MHLVGVHFLFLFLLISCQSDSGAHNGFIYDKVVESEESVMVRNLLRATSIEAVNRNVDSLSN